MLANDARRNGGQTATDPAVRPEGAPALHGVRVVDFTQFEAGTSCTELLAWLGAEVIKVESPVDGDPGRKVNDDLQKRPPGSDSYYFMALNANKRSVTADLKNDKGKAVIWKLIEQADVVVENFAPGTIERLGFGWEDVHKANPRAIYAQIKGFRPGSPYERFLSFDNVAQCMGGSASTTGEPDGKPLLGGFHIGDTGTGMTMVIGIVTALYQRQFTGRGQRVEVAMQDAVMNYGRSPFASGELRNEAAHRHGNGAFGKNVPVGMYRCKGDGPNEYIFVNCSVKGDAQFERLLKVIGKPELIGDPRYATADERRKRRAEVDAMLEEWTMQRDKRVAAQLLGDARIATGAVFDTKDLLHDPAMVATGSVVEVDHPVRGKFRMPGIPIRFSEFTVDIVPSPQLGEDNDEVYARLAGLDATRLAELRSEKAI